MTALLALKLCVTSAVASGIFLYVGAAADEENTALFAAACSLLCGAVAVVLGLLALWLL